MGNIILDNIDKHGYHYVFIRKSEGLSKFIRFKIHRLVADTFLNNPVDKHY